MRCGVRYAQALALGPLGIEAPVEFHRAALCSVPLLARAVGDVEREVVVHGAAVEMPKPGPGPVTRHLAARTVRVVQRFVTGHGLRHPGTFALNNCTRRPSVAFGVGRIEPRFANLFQAWDFGRQEVADCERFWLVRHFAEMVPARPEQCANEVVVHD